ncbi:uncharacterized protein UHOD_11091 [Ustilago sp. UG-2017b]|nr:uncharacterized protein UHOD_11091 [Ustilago sp. UG-2017b]
MLQARLYDNASTVKTIIACSSLQSWTKMMMTTLVALSVACDADTDQIPLPALFNTIVIETVSVETTARPHGPSLLSNDNHNEQPLYGAANVLPIHQHRKRTPICGVRQVKIGRHPIPVGCHGTLDQRAHVSIRTISKWFPSLWVSIILYLANPNVGTWQHSNWCKFCSSAFDVADFFHAKMTSEPCHAPAHPLHSHKNQRAYPTVRTPPANHIDSTPSSFIALHNDGATSATTQTPHWICGHRLF